MLLILSIVLNFLLSSPSFDHEDSDSELESFQEVRGVKFECRSRLAPEAKNLKILVSFEFGDLWDIEKLLGCCDWCGSEFFKWSVCAAHTYL